MLLIALSLVPILLFVMHFMTDEGTKGRLKTALLSQYIRLDSVADRERLTSTLRDLRSRMERLRKWFAAAFAAACIIALSTTIPVYIVSEREPLEKLLLETIETNLREHFELTLKIGSAFRSKDIFYRESNHVCTPIDGRQDFVDSKYDHFQRLEEAVKLLSDIDLKLVFVLSDILTVISVFTCILLAILSSMRITIFLMSRLVGSQLWVLPAFIAALLVALVVPFLMVQSVTYIFTAAFIRTAGTVPDFFYIDTPTILHLAAALSGLMSVIGLSPESLILLIMFKFHLGAGVDSVVGAIYSLFSLSLSSTRFGEFFEGVRRFNRFDFGISLVEAVRNWGIFTDLCFSGSYLFAGLALILSHKRPAVREYLLTHLEEIDSHPDGPFRALAQKTKILSASILAFFSIR